MSSYQLEMCRSCAGTGINGYAVCSECKGWKRRVYYPERRAGTPPMDFELELARRQVRIEELQTLLAEALPYLDQHEGHGRALAQRIQGALDD